MYLHIDRLECLQDEKVHLIVEGLQPEGLFKITVSLPHRTGTHFSYAVFKASSDGIIDPSTQLPIRGTYDEIDAMGLFASLYPREDVRKGATVWATPPEPYEYVIRLYNSSDQLMDSIDHIRHWKHPLVKEFDIENEVFVGTLYLPPGDGPFPTIIDFAGTGGGIRQHRSALLASRGFASLALPFFRYKNLPSALEDLDFDYFTRTVDWISKQSFCGRIGVQGNSFGGVICCLMANRTTKVSAYCIINSIHTVDPLGTFTVDGKELPTAKLPEQLPMSYLNDALWYSKIGESWIVPDKAVLSFKKCAKETKFRLVASMDDMNSSAIVCAHKLREKMEEEDLSVEVDAVPGGHLMESPYLPHMPYVYAAFTESFMLYGGQVYAHGKSQESVWERTIRFFEKHLGKPRALPEVECRNKL